MEEKRIGIEIRILANLIARGLNELSFGDECQGLTGPQGLVLGYLYSHQEQDVFQKDIEAMFNIRRSTATGLLQCLEGNGLVKRVNVDYDARLKKIILTPKAHSYKEALEAQIQKLEARLVKGLEPEEIDELFRIISKVKKNLE